MSDRALPVQLRNAGKAACRYYFSKKSVFAEQSILSEVPEVMYRRIVRQLYRKEIAGVEWLRTGDTQFVVQVVVLLKPMCAEPGDVLLDEDDLATEVMFIQHGCVHQLRHSERSGHEVLVGAATSGDMCGELACGRNVPQPVACRVAARCTLLAISKEDLAGQLAMVPAAGASWKRLCSSRWQAHAGALGSSECVESGQRTMTLISVNGTLLPCEANRKIFNYGLHAAHGGAEPELLRTKRKVAAGENGAPDRYSIDEEDASALPQRGIINPGNGLKVRWDLLVGALIVYSVIIIPYRLGFAVEADVGGAFYWFDWAVDTVFVCDIVVNFRTAYLDEGADALMTTPSDISRNYLTTWFAVDFFSVVPLELIATSVSGGGGGAAFRSFKLLKVVRLFRLLKLVKLLESGYVTTLYSCYACALLLLLPLLLLLRPPPRGYRHHRYYYYYY